jgi:peptide subunit release factor 1 (eRF1)
MATSSIGKTVYLTDEMADRIIEAMERVKANPPEPHTREIKWGDSKVIAEAIRRKYGSEE